MTDPVPGDPQPPPQPEDSLAPYEALLRQVRELEAQSASQAAHQRPMEELIQELQEQTQTLRQREEEMRTARPAPQPGEPEQTAEHRETMAQYAAMNARFDALERSMGATVESVRRMTTQTTFPTWFHAAYVDLAQRVARVESMCEEMGDSLVLIHTRLAEIAMLLAFKDDQGREEDAS